MQNNLVYQNVVRTFASLKQGSRLVVNGLIRYIVRHISRINIYEISNRCGYIGWIFCLYMVRLFLVFNKKT